MKEIDKNPITKKLLINSYSGEARLITRAWHAIDWSPDKFHLTQLAEDEVIAALIYMLDKQTMYRIRLFGKATVEPLYDYINSEDGIRFSRTNGLNKKEIQEPARLLYEMIVQQV